MPSISFFKICAEQLRETLRFFDTFDSKKKKHCVDKEI